MPLSRADKKIPFGREALGQILLPSRGQGNEMDQWVLKANINMVPRRK